MFRPFNSLYIRLVGITIIVISATIVVPIFTTVNRIGVIIKTESKSHVINYLDRLSPFLAEGTLTTEALESLFPPYIFNISSYEEEDKLPLTAAQHVLFDSKKNINVFDDNSIDGRFFVIVNSGGSYTMIDSDVGTLFSRIKQTSYLVSVMCFLIGAAVIIIGGRRAMRPVIMLDNAAKKVAGGDLSVRIDNDRCYKDELGSLINSFNTMMDELGKVEIFRNNFVSDVSHEFKIPLTTISGYAKLLQADCSSGERTEYTQVIMEESKHLSTLVDNILTINRLENRVDQTGAGMVAVTEQVRRALTIFEPVWTEKNIRVSFSLDEAVTRGFEALLMQVWSNLIDNAIKFTPSGGRVKIHLTQTNSGIVFTISDSGCGVEETQQQRIFDKFYKADNSRNSEGNGLGLAIVKRIVEIHSGTVNVHSEPGQGTRFTVFLAGVDGDFA